MSITAFSFGEWLPDMPDLGNPGLTVALNVIPKDKTYKVYLPLLDAGNAGPSRPRGALRPLSTNNPLLVSLYVGFDTSLQILTAGSFTNKSASTYSSSTVYWRFAQFDELVIATNKFDNPQRHTIGAATNFTSLAVSGTAPKAQHIGVVNEFLVLGNLVDSGSTAQPYSVAWPAITDPTNWPTPNSATAIATQSGVQRLDAALGEVTFIAGGDQFGIIAQQGGLTRMTYAGPPVVFQFDTYERGRGSFFPNAGVQAEGLFYFISLSGICVTDGVSVRSIGAGKTDRYFLDTVNFGFAERVYGAADFEQKLIFWGFPAVGPVPDTILIYNYAENRFTSASQAHEVLLSAALGSSSISISAFSSANKYASFVGSPGTATLTSGEVEPNPGGCALVNGIKAIVASSGTAPTMGVQVGSRDDQATSVSYSSTTAPTSRTGFADFRSDARFHRARVYIAGNFDKALGLEIDATPTGGM